MSINRKTIAVNILFIVATCSGLWLTARYSYLLFHSIVELFSIVVACSIFMLTWNARRFLDNHSLLFLGIAYLFVGTLDLLHTLSYKGMGVFARPYRRPGDSNLDWIQVSPICFISSLHPSLPIER